MLFRHILEGDGDREALVKGLRKLIRSGDGKGTLTFLAEASDRLEGKPVQTHQVAPKRTTIFHMACDHEPATLPGGPAPLKGEVSDMEERPFRMDMGGDGTR